LVSGGVALALVTAVLETLYGGKSTVRLCTGSG